MLFLQKQHFPEQCVIFGIRYLRIIKDVVAPAVVV
jgi:hypothetical protein